MAEGVIYLDVDDEITSAATRIRRAESSRVALVLPYGSRVATSRINFRLLSRDALTHEKRLSIIAPDAATRALAASAGLPVFTNVGEYEESLEERPRGGGAVEAAAAGAVAAADEHADAGDVPAEGPPTPRRRGRSRTAAEPGAATAAAAGQAGGGTTGAPASATDATTRTTVPAPARETVPPGEPGFRPATSIPVIPGRGRSLPRTPVLVGGAVLLLAALVVAVAGYVLLPAATVVVTPRLEAVGPLRFSVVADDSATEPDPTRRVVPAERLTLEVSVDDTFAATGRRVVQTRATGRVTFESLDTGRTKRIPAGAIVSTEGGVQFRTLRAIALPRAAILPPNKVNPSQASVDVEAVRQGPSGNVPSNAIVVVPSSEDPSILRVRNAEPTGGGTREEFPRITEEDVTGAIATLRDRLDEEFADQLADPSIVPPDTTLFPDTAMLGEPTPSVPAEELVGREEAEFALELTAEGSVIAVDPAPVETIAATLLEAEIRPGRELVEGSVAIDTGEPVVEGQQVSFPVVAEARQVMRPDPAELEALILGKPGDEARMALEPYGEVELELWPDWVSSVPTLDARVEVEVRDPTGDGGSGGSGASGSAAPASPDGTP